MKKLYQRGKYRVEVADDGAIVVRAGDWLSKYSAAIHGDYVHVHEYGRKNAQGAIEPVRNVNLIRAGETLYHLPTRQARRGTRVLVMPAEIITGSPVRELSPAEKKELIKQRMAEDYDLRGENLKIIDKAIEYVGWVDNVGTLAEIAGLLAEGTAAAGVATAVGVVSVLTTPVALAIAFVNASESGQRLMGMRGAAYATTAWAFGDARPPPSKAILDNLRSAPPYTPREYEAYISAWNRTVDATYKSLDAEVARRRVSTRSYQVMLMSLGNGDRAELCREIMRGFEKQLSGTALHVWMANYSIAYPR